MGPAFASWDDEDEYELMRTDDEPQWCDVIGWWLVVVGVVGVVCYLVLR